MSKEELEKDLERTYLRQSYSDGALCESRPGVARSSEVVFQCDPESNLREVLEVEVTPTLIQCLCRDPPYFARRFVGMSCW